MSMTENEKLQKAIEEEKELYEIMKDRYEKLGLKSCKDRAEEHEMNIKWLEEIQQYRAIGLTPELIEAMQGHNIALINDLGEYQQIGTIEELKALKEKNEPRKVIEHKTPYFVHWQCGNCGDEFYSGQTFCDDCGHSADWGELLK